LAFVISISVGLIQVVYFWAHIPCTGDGIIESCIPPSPKNIHTQLHIILHYAINIGNVAAYREMKSNE